MNRTQRQRANLHISAQQILATRPAHPENELLCRMIRAASRWYHAYVYIGWSEAFRCPLLVVCAARVRHPHILADLQNTHAANATPQSAPMAFRVQRGSARWSVQ